jgi:hypothetical protein
MSMLKVIPLVAALAVASPAQAQAPDREAQLLQELGNRVAGEPVRCINYRQVRNTRIINDTAILFRVGGTIFVNRPRSGAEGLDDSFALVNERSDGRLCSGDTLQLTEGMGISRTIVAGDFVPYSRAEN